MYEKSSREAKAAANGLKALLLNQKEARNLSFELLGPTPSWFHRRVGQFGYHVILKVPKGEDVLSELMSFLPKNVAIDRE